MARPKIYVSKDDEIATLKAKLAELENIKQEVEYKEEKTFRPEEYISVMSLLPHTLNLSTQSGGQGSNKRFTKFGEVKRILYRDLVEILEVNKAFVEGGYFYIMDPQLIRYHGLDDVYEKILTKEKIEDVLKANSESSVELYSTANERQKNIIIDLLIEEIINNSENINLNIIDKMSRISGIDIHKRAGEKKALREELIQK